MREIEDLCQSIAILVFLTIALIFTFVVEVEAIVRNSQISATVLLLLIHFAPRDIFLRESKVWGINLPALNFTTYMFFGELLLLLKYEAEGEGALVLLFAAISCGILGDLQEKAKDGRFTWKGNLMVPFLIFVFSFVFSARSLFHGGTKTLGFVCPFVFLLISKVILTKSIRLHLQERFEDPYTER